MLPYLHKELQLKKGILSFKKLLSSRKMQPKKKKKENKQGGGENKEGRRETQLITFGIVSF